MLTTTSPNSPPTQRHLIVLQCIWMLCTVFIGWHGYGADSDTWLTAHAALQLWEQGIYQPSRGLGNPLFEWLWTPIIYYGGHHAANFFVSVCGLMLWKGLNRLAGTFQIKKYTIGVSLLMFTPLVLCNAAATIDYIPALAAWVWAINYRHRQFVFVLLSLLLIGLRPAWVLLYWLTPLISNRFNIKSYILFAIVPVAIYLIYTSVFGVSLYDIPIPFLNTKQYFALVLSKGLQTVGLLGGVGLLLLFISIKRNHIVLQCPIPKAWIALVVISVMIQFCIFPYESAYLLPAFLLVWVAAPWHTFTTYSIRAAMFLLLSYHFIQIQWIGGPSGQRTLKLHIDAGYTIRQIEDQIWKTQVRTAINYYKPQYPTCLIFGATWIPMANTEWTPLNNHLFKKQDSELYIAEKLYTQNAIDSLKALGIQPVILEQESWDYIPLFEDGRLQRRDFKFFKTIEHFLGRNFKGRPLNQY